MFIKIDCKNETKLQNLTLSSILVDKALLGIFLICNRNSHLIHQWANLTYKKVRDVLLDSWVYTYKIKFAHIWYYFVCHDSIMVFVSNKKVYKNIQVRIKAFFLHTKACKLW